MPTVNRLYTFVPYTTIVSAEVNAELDQIIDLLNGTDVVKSLRINKNTSYGGGDNPLTVRGTTARGGVEIGGTAGIGNLLSFFIDGNPAAIVQVKESGAISAIASHGDLPASQYALLSGATYVRSNAMGNVGAGEDDLHSFSIGAFTLRQTSSKGMLVVRSSGYTAANGNNKRMRFYVKTTPVLDSGVITENNKPFFFELRIAVSEDVSTELKVEGTFRCGATEVRTMQILSGFDSTVNNTCKWTAEAVANNDIVQQMFSVEKIAAFN